MNTLSSKYSKIPALEGTFSNSQNTVTFSIPGGMKLDLSECAVLLDFQMTTTETNARNMPRFDGSNGVYRNYIAFIDDGVTGTLVPTAALVKNADMHCKQVGQIESLRRCDTLAVALKQYTQSIEEKESDCYFGLASTVDTAPLKTHCPFTQMNKLGSLASRAVSNAVRIPLKDVFNVCNAPVYDTNKYGETTLKFEMNFDHLTAVQDLPFASANFRAADKAIDSPATQAGASTVSSFVTTAVYTNPERDSPWYVGMKMVLQYTLGGVVYSVAAGNAPERVITSITHSTVDGKLTLNIDAGDAIATGAGDAWALVSFSPVDPATNAFVFNKIELEMKQVADPTPSGIDYFTYQTEEDSGFNGAANINKQYSCSAESDNLVICCPDDIIPKKVITVSRVTIDNVEETTEDVTTFSSLYYDRQNRFWLNMGGGDLKNLRDRTSAQAAEEANLGARVLALGQPLPVKQIQKQVQLDLDCGGDIERLHLYKRVPKSI